MNQRPSRHLAHSNFQEAMNGVKMWHYSVWFMPVMIGSALSYKRIVLISIILKENHGGMLQLPTRPKGKVVFFNGICSLVMPLPDYNLWSLTGNICSCCNNYHDPVALFRIYVCLKFLCFGRLVSYMVPGALRQPHGQQTLTELDNKYTECDVVASFRGKACDKRIHGPLTQGPNYSVSYYPSKFHWFKQKHLRAKTINIRTINRGGSNNVRENGTPVVI